MSDIEETIYEPEIMDDGGFIEDDSDENAERVSGDENEGDEVKETKIGFKEKEQYGQTAEERILDETTLEKKYQYNFTKLVSTYNQIRTISESKDDGDSVQLRIGLNLIETIKEKITDNSIPFFEFKNPAGLLLGYMVLVDDKVDEDRMKDATIIGKKLEEPLYPIHPFDIFRYAYFWINIVNKTGKLTKTYKRQLKIKRKK